MSNNETSKAKYSDKYKTALNGLYPRHYGWYQTQCRSTDFQDYFGVTVKAGETYYRRYVKGVAYQLSTQSMETFLSLLFDYNGELAKLGEKLHEINEARTKEELMAARDLLQQSGA